VRVPDGVDVEASVLVGVMLPVGVWLEVAEALELTACRYFEYDALELIDADELVDAVSVPELLVLNVGKLLEDNPFDKVNELLAD
jgi:hypothetical protein